MARFSRKVVHLNISLVRFRPDIVLVVMHWRDLRLDVVSGNEDEVINRVIEEHKTLWKRLFGRFRMRCRGACL